MDTEEKHLIENAKLIQNDMKILNSKLDTFLNELNKRPKECSNGNCKKSNEGTNSPRRDTMDESSSLWSAKMVNMTTKLYESNNRDELPERVFVKRNSLLTELLKIPHVRTIRNIFISIMIVMALQVMFKDYMEKGRLDLNFNLIQWCFGKIPIVIYTWSIMMFTTSCCVYYCFHFWANNRLTFFGNQFIQLKNKEKFSINRFNLFDTTWLIIYIFYILLFVISPAYVVIVNKLPTASAFIVLLEQIRMIMKTHAFVRSNIPKTMSNCQIKINEFINAQKSSSSSSETEVPHSKEMKNTNEKPLKLDWGSKNYKEDSDCEEEETNDEHIKMCPNFTNYLYFLFAPTLVYRDNYPRTPRVRWYFVFTKLSQVLGAILYTYYIFERFCIPVFQHFNTEHVTLEMFVQSIFNCTLPGTLLLLVGFYAFLHCYLNATAEMLRFADRMFYKDWWNSTNYSIYYRTWNVVVHDWLFTYIYKDLYKILGKKNKTVCQFVIFFISAAFHEYVLALGFGFFYPVLFVMFGAVGFSCMFLKTKKESDFWNFITWIGLLIGLGGLMCLYSIEWYARQNCPQSFDSAVLDYLLPRSFTCGMNKVNQINIHQIHNNTILKLNQIKVEF